MNDGFLENVTFNELTIGQTASLTKKLTQEDIHLFAVMSGDVNPAHMDPDYAQSDVFQGVVGHGMWSGSMISTILGTILPGPGTIYMKQDIIFKKPLRLNDTLNLTLIVKEKKSDKPIATFNCIGKNQRGETILEGEAMVLVPTDKIRVPRTELPDVAMHHHDRFRGIIDACRNVSPLRTAVVHPVKASVLKSVMEAASEKLIEPVLIGPVNKITEAANALDIDLSFWELIDTEHSDAAAKKAVELAAIGEVSAIQKGALKTNELMVPVVSGESGLRTKYRISHAYVMDVPSYHKPLIITDAAINIAPSARDKADICQNAINLWQVLYGYDQSPKVAILAATELVDPKMQATVDAATLCKMADRQQITGGMLDGPLAFDNAINKEAAIEKGIASEVAGNADILLVPDIESGNILAKQLTFLGHSDAAGIVLGARVPIILTSRSDSLRTRLLSSALAVHLANAREKGSIK